MISMDLRTATNLRHVQLEPCRSIPVVSINHNREEVGDEYEARMMGSWGLNNNYKPGGNKRSCDFCVKGDKYSDNELIHHMKLHHLDLLFKCSVCQKSFPNWTDAQKHVSNYHKTVTTKTVITPTDPENLLKASCRLKKCRRSFVSKKCRLSRFNLTLF